MNRLARWMMRLYPARWRERYGDELDVLISDAGADARTVADLARGGIRMQFSTWSFPKLAVVLGVVGVFLGVAASFLAKPMYESDVRLAMQGTPDQLYELIELAQPALLSRSELSSVINDPRLLLYKEQLRTMPLEDVIERMRSNTRIAAGPNQTIEISFRYPDAMEAYRTVAVLADKFRTFSDSQRTTRASEAAHPSLDVLDTANLPVIAPAQRTIERITLLLGLSIPFLWRRMRHKKLLSWWLLLSLPVCGLLGIISGELVAVYQSSGEHYLPGYRYRSTATMETDGITQKQVQGLIDGALTHTSLSAIIQDPRLMLYSDELKNTPLEEVIREMKRRLTIAPVPDHPNYITIAFEYRDRFKTQQTAEAVMVRMNELWQRGSDRMAIVSLGTWGPVSIQDPPIPTATPIGPDRYKFAGVGGIVGMIIGGLIGLIRRRWTPEPDNNSANAISG